MWQLRSVDFSSLLREGHGVLVLGLRRGIRQFTILVGASVAVALAIAGVLSLVGMIRLATLDRGVHGDPMVVDVRFSRELARAGMAELQGEFLEALSASGLSASAGFGSALPLDPRDRRFIAVDAGAGPVMASVIYQTGSFVSALDLTLLAGHPMHAGAEPTAVINDTLARRLFGGSSVLGRGVRAAGTPSTIVGIVGGTVATGDELAARVPEIYLPYPRTQSTGPAGLVSYLAGRCDTGRICGEAFARFATGVFRDRPGVVVTNPRPLSSRLAQAMAPARMQASLLSFLAVMSSILALLSVVAIVAFVTQSRRTELAIRRALGASRLSVAWLVSRESVVAGGCGVAIGGLLCGLLGREFEHMLGPGMFPSNAIVVPTAIVVIIVLSVGALIPPLRIVGPSITRADLQEGRY